MNLKDIKPYRPLNDSHKGQNGKLLVIGGSQLFHSSIFWSADVASKIVDLVHLTSPANENNQIFRSRLKEKFWNGIVVDWKDVESYIEEDDCILIGPGMIRGSEFSEHSENSESRISSENQTVGVSENPALRPSESLTFRHSEYSEFSELLNKAAKSDKTSVIVNTLLRKYPFKRWVIDGGALQEVDLEAVPKMAILTPHRGEFDILMKKFSIFNLQFSINLQLDNLTIEDQVKLIAKTLGCTILFKDPVDIVCQGDRCNQIAGGNPGMTKGGTGDVLAGLVAALYCKNDAWAAATIGSRVNKKSGDQLYKKVGPYFNAADLVAEVPKVLAKFAKPVASREVS